MEAPKDISRGASLARIALEHVRLVEGLGRLRDAVDTGSPPHMPGFFERWMSLVSFLIRHLEDEDQLFYPLMAQSPDESVRDRADRLQQDFGILYAYVQAYGRRWCPDSMATRWTSFARETDEILAALEARIDLEEAQLRGLGEA